MWHTCHLSDIEYIYINTDVEEGVKKMCHMAVHILTNGHIRTQLMAKMEEPKWTISSSLDGQKRTFSLSLVIKMNIII